MKIAYNVFPFLFVVLLFIMNSANAEHNAVNVTDVVIQPSAEKTVQIVTACDGRKKVIVEGYYEGEVMPVEKSRQVAQLLMSLMEFCEEEITAKLPESERTIYVSVNGLPFESVRDIEELPLILAHGDKPHTERQQRIWKAEMDRIIGEGYRLFHDPSLGKNGISCDMCHPDASNTHPETYPKFQTQTGMAALLRDMINWCIQNPLEGNVLADDDQRMKALESYIISTRAGKILLPGKH